MATLWILSANSGGAKIFEVKGHGKHIAEIYNIENPDGRKKSGEILSDRPGRAFDRVGGGRHAFSQQNDVHEQAIQVFAHKLEHILKQGHDTKLFDELAILAPPHFLGELKQVLSTEIRKKVVKEVPKDMSERLSEAELIEQLCKYFDLWNHQTTAT